MSIRVDVSESRATKHVVVRIQSLSLSLSFCLLLALSAFAIANKYKKSVDE